MVVFLITLIILAGRFTKTSEVEVFKRTIVVNIIIIIIFKLIASAHRWGNETGTNLFSNKTEHPE